MLPLIRQEVEPSDGEWWGVAGNTDEALLAHLLLTSCCVARLLTGHRLLVVWGQGPQLGTPVLKNNEGWNIYISIYLTALLSFSSYSMIF